MESTSTSNTTATNTRRGEIWVQRAITLWVILAVAVSVKTIVQPDRHTVYPVFAQGARHWWSDVPLYDRYDRLDLFRYSPAFAIAVTPFGMLPDWLGGIGWNLLSIAVLVWALRILVRDVLPGSWPPWREGLFLGLALVGSVRGIWSGQNNAFLLAAAIFGLAAVAKRRWWPAALLLAVPVFIKIWPLALVLLLMARWPKELIWRFSLAVAVLAAVPFMTRPPSAVLGQYYGWYAMLADTGQVRWGGYRDAWTIWENIRPPVQGNVYLALQLVTAAMVLAWCLYQARRTRSTRQLLTSILAIWVAWQLLFGPGSERLTYIIIAPAATWALMASFAGKRLRVLGVTAWLMTGLLGTGGVERALLPYFPQAPIIPPMGVVVFAVWLVAHQRGRADESQSHATCEPASKTGQYGRPTRTAA